jgi:hypothetical protein
MVFRSVYDQISKLGFAVVNTATVLRAHPADLPIAMSNIPLVVNSLLHYYVRRTPQTYRPRVAQTEAYVTGEPTFWKSRKV